MGAPRGPESTAAANDTIGTYSGGDYKSIHTAKKGQPEGMFALLIPLFFGSNHQMGACQLYYSTGPLTRNLKPGSD